MRQGNILVGKVTSRGTQIWIPSTNNNSACTCNFNTVRGWDRKMIGICRLPAYLQVPWEKHFQENKAKGMKEQDGQHPFLASTSTCSGKHTCICTCVRLHNHTQLPFTPINKSTWITSNNLGQATQTLKSFKKIKLDVYLPSEQEDRFED